MSAAAVSFIRPGAHGGGGVTRRRVAAWMLAALAAAHGALAQTWGGHYTTGAFDRIDRCDDGGYVVISTTGSVTSCMKTDAQGQPLWRTTLDTPSTDSFYDVAAMGGGCVAVGRTDEGALRYNLGIVVRFDASGSVLWQRVFDRDVQSYWQGVTVTADGRIIVAGVRESGTTDLAVLALDAAGNPLWMTGISRMSAQCSGGSSLGAPCWVGERADGTILVATTAMRSCYPADVDFDALVVALSPDGGVLWRRACGASDWDEYGERAALSRTGGLHVTGEARRDGDTVHGYVAQLDAGGRVEWARRWGVLAAGTFWQGVATAPDGGCIVVDGELDPTTQVGKMVRFTRRGDIAWQWRYPDDTFVGVVPAPDAGFVASGIWIRTFGGRADLVRFDDLGTTRASCITAEPGTAAPVVPVFQEWEPDFAIESFTPVPADPAAVVTLGAGPLPCAVDACPPLACLGIESDPLTPCAGEEAMLTLRYDGGEVVTVAWDLDGDGATDAVGNPVFVQLPIGTASITATATDACPRRAQRCQSSTTVTVIDSARPLEVSAVRAGDVPLRVASHGARITAQEVPGIAYDAHAGAIGTWFASSAAAGSGCGVAATPNGDGTVTLGVTLAPQSWLLVTARTACHEGPAGTTSLGLERSSHPAWRGCR